MAKESGIDSTKPVLITAVSIGKWSEFRRLCLLKRTKVNAEFDRMISDYLKRERKK